MPLQLVAVAALIALIFGLPRLRGQPPQIPDPAPRPLVNQRNGVSILSENTGAHEELGEFALSVNPFNIQELADAIFSALTMEPERRKQRIDGLKAIVTERDPGDWVDDQLADIRSKAEANEAAAS